MDQFPSADLTPDVDPKLAEQYENLPESIKAQYTMNQYLWLGADMRARLVTAECSDPLWTEP